MPGLGGWESSQPNFFWRKEEKAMASQILPKKSKFETFIAADSLYDWDLKICKIERSFANWPQSLSGKRQ